MSASRSSPLTGSRLPRIHPAGAVRDGRLAAQQRVPSSTSTSWPTDPQAVRGCCVDCARSRGRSTKWRHGACPVARISGCKLQCPGKIRGNSYYEYRYSSTVPYYPRRSLFDCPSSMHVWCLKRPIQPNAGEPTRVSSEGPGTAHRSRFLNAHTLEGEQPGYDVG